MTYNDRSLDTHVLLVIQPYLHGCFLWSRRAHCQIGNPQDIAFASSRILTVCRCLKMMFYDHGIRGHLDTERMPVERRRRRGKVTQCIHQMYSIPGM